MDDSIVVRAKEYMLSVPVVAPKTWEAISAAAEKEPGTQKPFKNIP